MDICTLKLAREALGGLTPLKTDCGRLCGAACCHADEDGKGGVHLFPGEEKFYENAGWCEIEYQDIAPALICKGACPRAERPLGCRIFPLTPARRGDGSWTVRIDARAREMCPLARSGVRGLERDFAKAALAAIKIVAAAPDGEKFLEAWIALEEKFRNFTL